MVNSKLIVINLKIWKWINLKMIDQPLAFDYKLITNTAIIFSIPMFSIDKLANFQILKLFHFQIV